MCRCSGVVEMSGSVEMQWWWSSVAVVVEMQQVLLDFPL